MTQFAAPGKFSQADPLALSEEGLVEGLCKLCSYTQTVEGDQVGAPCVIVHGSSFSYVRRSLGRGRDSICGTGLGEAMPALGEELGMPVLPVPRLERCQRWHQVPRCERLCLSYQVGSRASHRRRFAVACVYGRA